MVVAHHTLGFWRSRSVRCGRVPAPGYPHRPAQETVLSTLATNLLLAASGDDGGQNSAIDGMCIPPSSPEAARSRFVARVDRTVSWAGRWGYPGAGTRPQRTLLDRQNPNVWWATTIRDGRSPHPAGRAGQGPDSYSLSASPDGSRESPGCVAAPVSMYGTRPDSTARASTATEPSRPATTTSVNTRGSTRSAPLRATTATSTITVLTSQPPATAARAAVAGGWLVKTVIVGVVPPTRRTTTPPRMPPHSPRWPTRTAPRTVPMTVKATVSSRTSRSAVRKTSRMASAVVGSAITTPLTRCEPAPGHAAGRG